MCTVTYVRQNDSTIVLTSNRDERIHRITTIPEKYTIGDRWAIFPKDNHAGGTWISMGSKGIACCLLNGAFEMHERKPMYSRSRGQVLLDVFRFETLDEFIDKVDLSGVEPFTLVLVNVINGDLKDLIWDEKRKHVREYDQNGNHFWSSAYVYSRPIAIEREQHFRELSEKKKLNHEEVLLLHSKTKGEGGFLLKTEWGIETISISQLLLRPDKGSFYYEDLLKKDSVFIESAWE